MTNIKIMGTVGLYYCKCNGNISFMTERSESGERKDVLSQPTPQAASKIARDGLSARADSSAKLDSDSQALPVENFELPKNFKEGVLEVIDLNGGRVTWPLLFSTLFNMNLSDAPSEQAQAFADGIYELIKARIIKRVKDKNHKKWIERSSPVPEKPEGQHPITSTRRVPSAQDIHDLNKMIRNADLPSSQGNKPFNRGRRRKSQS